jgi:ABC-2 type transport system ATP-binding protein
VEPDILLVDETLSVGDGIFRHMGIQKMRELQESGATTIFVTHSTRMVKDFCTEAALLQNGSLVAYGDVSETVDYYEAMISSATALREERASKRRRRPKPEVDEDDGAEAPVFKEDPKLEDRGSHLRHGTGEAKIQSVEILDGHGRPTGLVAPDSTMTVRVHLEYLENVKSTILSITLRNKTGLDVFSTNTNLHKTPIKNRRVGDRIIVDFTLQMALRHGPYSVAAGISQGQNREAYMDWVSVASAFEIARPAHEGLILGMVRLPTKVTVSEPQPARDPEQSA